MSTIQHTGAAFRHPVAFDCNGLAQIGRSRLDLMGIRFHSGTPGEPTNTPPPAPAPTDPPTPPTPPVPGVPSGVPNPTGGVPTNTPPPADAPAINPATGKPFTAAETQAHISKLNDEAKTAREAKEAADKIAADATARANNILKAAGFNPDGTPYSELTPEQVAAATKEKDDALNQSARENLLLRVSPTLGANADKLLDSVTFKSKLAALKPDDRAGVEALVRETIENDATYKVTPAAASSGSAAHTGTPPTDKRLSKSAAIADRYKAPSTS